MTSEWVFGLGSFLIVASFLFKNDRWFLITLSLGCLSYGLHFYALGLIFPFVIQFLHIIRQCIAAYKKSLWLSHFFMAGYLIAFAFTYDSLVSVLILFACAFGTYGSLLFHGIKLRLFYMCATVMWVIHNAVVGTVPGLAMELTVACINGFTIYRLYCDGQRQKGA